MAKNKKSEPSVFALTLGARIKLARGERTYQEVSAATSGFIHPRMLINYEEGTEPRYSTLVVLAAALGVTLSYLVSADVVNASESRNTARLIELVGN